MLTFHEWLANRVPDATSVAIQIAGAGPTGVSLEDLGRAVGIPGETLAGLLRALVTAGQVVMVRVNGRLRYRAAG
jgi:hypothetical protein